MMVVTTREERFTGEHFCQDAPDRPNIDGFGVLFESEHDFRSSVPTGSDVFCHETRSFCFGLVCRSCQTKIANLEIAIGVEQEIRGFEITMQHLSRMQRFQTPQSLIDKVLTVVVRQFLGSNDTVHIGFHEFLDEVDFGEAVVVVRFDNVEDRDDVFVVKVTKEFDLAESAETEHGVIERSDFLNGYSG